MKKYKAAFVKNHIDWDREGIFDKYMMQALLEKANVDVYTNNVPEKIPKYLLNKGYGTIRIFKFKSFGPFFPTYFHVYLKLKRIEKKYDILFTDWEFYNIGNALLDSKKSVIWFQTPDRGFYDLHEYRILTKKNIFRRIAQHIWDQQRFLDNIIVRNTKNALIIANSNNVAKRIYKAYLKYPYVIYPAPARRKTNTLKEVEVLKDKTFFLTVNRIVPEKRIELSIEAFKKLKNKTLAIAGWFGTDKYVEYLKRLAEGYDNIIFLDRRSEEEINWLYTNCEAVIQTCLDEDYGMVPSEGMTYGKPTIAVAEGGFTEIIIQNFNGRLIIQPYIENLIKEVKTFNPKLYNKTKIKQFVRKNLEYNAFQKNFWKYVERHLNENEAQKKIIKK